MMPHSARIKLETTMDDSDLASVPPQGDPGPSEEHGVHTSISGLLIETMSTRVTEPPLELFISPKAFRPNPVTVRFARTVRVEEGDIVFDMGTGIAPLAIKAALDGARQVYGVDPVPMHCELAMMNVAKYGQQEKVRICEGLFFDPLDLEPTEALGSRRRGAEGG